MLLLECDKPKKAGQSIREITFKNKVKASTLGRHANGGRLIMQFLESHQKLTVAKEKMLVEWICQSVDQGLPLTCDRVTKMAKAVLKMCLGSQTSLGIHWIDRFLMRHEKVLSSHWSKPLDTLPANCLNPEAVTDWFENIVKSIYVDKGIKPHNTYGMDESGFQPSDHGSRRVIGQWGTKRQHHQCGRDRENITVLINHLCQRDCFPPYYNI